MVNTQISFAASKLATGAFAGLSSTFDDALTKISAAVPKGKGQAFNEYSAQWQIVNSAIKKVVDALSPESLEWVWVGLETQSKLEKRADDVVNSLMNTWDTAASKAVRGSDATAELTAAQARLAEFDDVLTSKGSKKVKKDS